MHKSIMSLLVLFVLLVSRGPAHAQQPVAPASLPVDQAQTGLTMGYPTSVGLVWHVSDRVAIRPDFSVTKGSNESASLPPLQGLSSGSTSRSDLWSYGVGVSALFYLHRWDSLRVYVSPRVTYTRSSTTSTTTLLSSFSGSTSITSDSVSSGVAVAGSFGAQYSLSRRFSVFGEVGFGYSEQSGSLVQEQRGSFALPANRSELSSNFWSTRSGVGLIFYF